MLTETSQGQTAAPFPFRPTEVTHLDISGGTWHNIEGNSFTLQNCKVFVAKDGKTLQTSPLSPTRPHSNTKRGVIPCMSGDSRVRTKASQTREPSSAPTPTLPPSASPSTEFLIALTKLEDINQLIAPHTDAIGIFKRVGPYLQDLTVLVGFASTAYTACGRGTILGNIVRVAIDTQMKHCNRALSQLLVQIAWLPHRSFPRARYAYSVVHEWWTGNEPREIRMIRLSISEEVTTIGEWLRCLHSFWWASRQLLTMNSTFTMENLREFLESGPILMLRQIIIEEMIFLEPLQGEHRSIPLRFVETFEDVHMAIGMACERTAASRFIEHRQYQLDESTTDATVSQEDLLQRIDTCRVFEITITFSRLDMSADECPRCEKSYDDSSEKNSNGWIRCHRCGTKFNAYTSMPTKAKIDEEEIEINRTFDGAWSSDTSQPKSSSEVGMADKMETHIREIPDSMEEEDDFRSSTKGEDYEGDDIDIDDALGVSDEKVARLFRRIKFEVEPDIGPLLAVPGHLESSPEERVSQPIEVQPDVRPSLAVLDQSSPNEIDIDDRLWASNARIAKLFQPTGVELNIRPSLAVPGQSPPDEIPIDHGLLASDAQITKLFQPIEVQPDVRPALAIPDPSSLQRLWLADVNLEITHDGDSRFSLQDVESNAQPQPQASPSPEHLNATPLIILLGKTGAGKSTFVNACIPGAGAAVSPGLSLCSTTVTCFPSKGFVLADTPGFDDPDMTPDGALLQHIIDQIAKHTRRDAPCGVIFMRDRAESENGKALSDLRRAFARRTGSIHELVTSTCRTSNLSYNGTTFSNKSPTLQAFCQDRVHEALKDGLLAQDVLELLQKSQVLVRHPGQYRTPKKSAWWMKFRAMLQ
ncbi:hypothetical protein BKA70DRAFT_1566696 [Coprinopsis sp. MPI-PUGE-AT-0042]|nr:hypothetical protein BKA70DRAFT_1566696 [Coprinopsis sp. MPI-PUGE-AT-0042]